MQSPVELLSYSALLVLAALVDLSLQAAIKGGQFCKYVAEAAEACKVSDIEANPESCRKSIEMEKIAFNSKTYLSKVEEVDLVEAATDDPAVAPSVSDASTRLLQVLLQASSRRLQQIDRLVSKVDAMGVTPPVPPVSSSTAPVGGSVAAASMNMVPQGASGNVGSSLKSKTPISVEHELQALVDTGVLDSSEQSTVNHSPLSLRSSNGQGIEPADLARAATLVDAQLKAQAQEQTQQQSRDTPQQQAPSKMAANKADDMPLPEKADDPLTSLDLTPRAVAEYLLITGDFGGFEQAIRDLLTTNIITIAEASQYKDAVGWEYETLLYKLVNVKAASLQEFMEADQLSSKSNAINRGRSRTVVSKPGKAAAMLPPHKVMAPGVNLHSKLRQLQMRALVEKEETLDELLNVINQNAVEDNNSDFYIGGNLVSKRSPEKAAAVVETSEKDSAPETKTKTNPDPKQN